MNCNGCGKNLKKDCKTGYCANCFHKNVDNIKTEYAQKRWSSGVSKEHHWKARGIKLTAEDIDTYNKQSNCQICNKEFDNDKVLDHCHTTGNYRGALCRQCNASLGKLGDDIDLIISRLKKYKKK